MNDDRSSELSSVILKGAGLLAVMAVLIAVGTYLVVHVLGLNDAGTKETVFGQPASVSPLPTTALPEPSASQSAGDGSGDQSDDPTDGLTDASTEEPGVVPSQAAAKGLLLSITPLTARPMERLNITGTYAGHDNTGLQVQRLEGGHWADFPTQAQVNMGTFETYVMTSHPGANRFRVFDPATNSASNIVTIDIR